MPNAAIPLNFSATAFTALRRETLMVALTQVSVPFTVSPAVTVTCERLTTSAKLIFHSFCICVRESTPVNAACKTSSRNAAICGPLKSTSPVFAVTSLSESQSNFRLFKRSSSASLPVVCSSPAVALSSAMAYGDTPPLSAESAASTFCSPSSPPPLSKSMTICGKSRLYPSFVVIHRASITLS